jgi:hypothetical protein
MKNTARALRRHHLARMKHKWLVRQRARRPSLEPAELQRRHPRRHRARLQLRVVRQPAPALRRADDPGAAPAPAAVTGVAGTRLA